MTRRGLLRHLHRVAGTRLPQVLLAAAAVALCGCGAEPDVPSAEASARDEVAAVVARHLPAVSEPSRHCLADRLAADGVQPDALERFLVDGQPGSGDERRGLGVALELSVTIARAVCLTAEELLAAG